ncbi:MAG: hypothetical protein VCC04_16475 [Myxococcota bacterium]
MLNRRTLATLVLSGLALALLGAPCMPRYQMGVASGGALFRIDTQTGEVCALYGEEVDGDTIISESACGLPGWKRRVSAPAVEN